MNQKSISKILTGLGISVGVLAGLLFYIYIPMAINDLVKYAPEVEFLKWPSIIGVGVVSGVCYYALYQFLCICKQIGLLNSFCNENVLALRHIALAAMAVGILIVLGDIYLFVVGWLHPGLFLVSLFFIFVALAFAIVCFCLSSL